MLKRTLGKTGLDVSALGFGCMGISFGYGPAASRQDRLAIIQTLRKVWREDDSTITLTGSCQP